MFKGKKKIIPIVVILLAVATVVYLCLNGRKESIYVGTIEATKVDVSPRLSSVIDKLLVDEGSQVKKGDLLFILSCEDVAVKRETVTKDFQRAQTLVKSGAMPREEYDHIKSSFDDVNIKWQWCEVKSPIEGTVLQKYREEGEFLTVGMKTLTLVDLQDIWAYVYVDQPVMSKLSIGREVEGFLPELKKVVKGSIIHINDEAEFTPKNVQTRRERTRLVYGIKISFQNEERILKPGMPIEVDFGPKVQ